MKTDKATLDNIKKGIVTEQMLADAIFSYNKRAKNMRDKESDYRRYFNRNWYAYDKYDNVDKYKDKKEDYYKRKDECLELLNPVALHTVERERSYKKWDKREEYYHYQTESFTEYYAVYKLACYSFHHPIEKEMFDELSETLPVENIDDLNTEGRPIEYLMSVQTVDKIRKGLKDGSLRLVFEGES